MFDPATLPSLYYQPATDGGASASQSECITEDAIRSTANSAY